MNGSVDCVKRGPLQILVQADMSICTLTNMFDIGVQACSIIRTRIYVGNACGRTCTGYMSLATRYLHVF